MAQPILTTDRLILRSFNSNDAETVRKLAGNHNVAKQTLNIPHPYEQGVAEAWIETHHMNWEQKGLINCAVVSKNSNELLGTVNFVRNDEKSVELGYWMGEPYWGMGYCTEAVNELVRFAFEELDKNSVVARHLSTNPASGAVMLKAGLRYKKTEEQLGRYGQPVSLKVYEILNK